ncbi:MAG: TetR/AcrR family transcriptional regulator [Anaerolineales bacterium]|nr:TetR/AcrR family transcriptional regulator [Anaerolineales bacterium]
MARKRDVKPAETRGAILRAAYAVFLKRGYHATSMRDIAARAKLSVAAAYNHFKNKDDLFVAVLHEHHPYTHILPALAEVRGDTVEDFLRQAARRILQVLDREPGFLRLMLIEIVEFDSRHIPALFSDFIPRLVEFTRSVTRKQGSLRPIPLPVLIRSFGGLFISYYVSEIMIWKFLPKSMRTDCLDDFIEIYLHGVLAPAPAGAV